MKVFLVNGSPHQHGCTDRALREVASALEQGGVETELFWIGNRPIGGCIGCSACAKLGRCAFDGPVNEFAEKLDSADGFVFGSPVHYAAASGNMTSFLDRLFYSASEKMRGKPAAVVVFVSQPSLRAVTVPNWARVIVWPRPKVLLVMPDMRP